MLHKGVVHSHYDKKRAVIQPDEGTPLFAALADLGIPEVNAKGVIQGFAKKGQQRFLPPVGTRVRFAISADIPCYAQEWFLEDHLVSIRTKQRAKKTGGMEPCNKRGIRIGSNRVYRH